MTMIATFFCTSSVMAQSTDPDDLGQDPGVPVDGGISILLAAGATLGARRLYRVKSNKVRKS